MAVLPAPLLDRIERPAEAFAGGLAFDYVVALAGLAPVVREAEEVERLRFFFLIVRVFAWPFEPHQFCFLRISSDGRIIYNYSTDPTTSIRTGTFANLSRWRAQAGIKIKF